MLKQAFHYSTQLLGVLQRTSWTSFPRDMSLIHQALHCTFRLAEMQRLVVFQFIVVCVVQIQLREVFTPNFALGYQHQGCLSVTFLLLSMTSSYVTTFWYVAKVY